MAFVTDGSVHYSGIKNEDNTAKICTKQNTYGCKVETRGYETQGRCGSRSSETLHQRKADTIFWFFRLGQHQQGRLNFLAITWTPLSKKYPRIREMDIDDRVTYLESTREKFADTCSAAFDYLTHQQASELIAHSISHGIDEVLVNDQEHKIIYRFNPENHPAVKMAQTCDSIKFTGTGKGSRKVIFVKDGVEYNYGIRLRITSNNGITAFLGLF